MSIVKESSALRKALEKRLLELYPNGRGGFNQAIIIKDAEERGFKIAAAPLSKYFNGIEKGSLSEIQIVFLALRYGIPIKLEVGAPYIKRVKDEASTEPDATKLTIGYIIPKFNEVDALTKLNIIFK